MGRKQWFHMLAATLVVAVVSAATEQAQPKANEFRDGSFFVSWRYATQSDGTVSPTQTVTKSPPVFRADEAFELSITLRVPKGAYNPCAAADCDMRATLTLLVDGKEGTLAIWEQDDVLKAGLQTFPLHGALSKYGSSTRGYIDYQILKGDESLVQGHFPFRITRP